MAVKDKPNEEYYSLKARLDKWGLILIVIYPFFGGILLVFGGAYLGHRLNQNYGVGLGFVVGFLVLATSSFYFCHKKIGFIYESKEMCQNCGVPMARWNGAYLALDYWCRRCGNKNYIDLQN